MASSRKRPIAAAGWAPTKPVTGLPSLKTATVGMLWMPYWAARICSASTSTLASSTLPPRLATSDSIAGPRMRQGPHQAAQKSTTTGSSRERSTTSRSKVSLVTSIVSFSSSVWQRPAAAGVDVQERVERAEADGAGGEHERGEREQHASAE